MGNGTAAHGCSPAANWRASAAIVMILVQSAKLHGRDPWVYLKDVLERLLSHPNSRIEELLPHRWRLTVAGKMPAYEEH